MRSTGSRPILHKRPLSFPDVALLLILAFNFFSILPLTLPNIFRKEPKAKAFNRAMMLKLGTSGPPTITGFPHCNGMQKEVGKYSDGMGLNFFPGLKES